MIEKILSYAKKQNASDIHISADNPPLIRIDGDLMIIPGAPIFTDEQVQKVIFSLISPQQKEIYLNSFELDFMIQIDDLRFRVNAFKTLSGAAAAFREIPTEIRDLDMLGAPQVLKSILHAKKGLVLVVGPTGSGKSTTLAAMIDYINTNFYDHILTIEDPVEFVHKGKRSLINQRSVGSSTLSFSNALRSALREDPNVILVGEMRDKETINLAITAAETGHLVLGTLHTSSSAQTINRIVDVFPAEDKPAIRSIISGSLRAVVSQRLLKKVGGGRCAAYEIMIANSSIRNLIREDKIPQINSIIELSRKSGMMLMKDSILSLKESGTISKEIAEESLIAFEN